CEESDGEGVPETLFDEDGLMKNQSEEENMDKHDDMSEDPFRIYSLLKKKDKEGRGGNSENGNEGNVDVDNVVPSGNHCGMNSNEGETESVCSGHFKKSEVPRTGGFILSLLDDVVKVGQVMGYKMDGCMSNMAEIIESQRVDETCWGNMDFDYVHSDSVGNSGGILCVWDPNAFCKSSVTMSDYFIMVRGVWRQNVVMGDFNEVQKRSNRFGSVFNVQGANVFNSFISSVGLVEVSLGGCSFTWCHKSAIKMSKLDRFLVSESLLNTCLNISAITLERYLSDHRPILLREYHFDYGPTPFRFFRCWFEMEGFSKIVEDAWKESPSEVSNEEIKRAVWDCGTDKAPGRDGFTLGFYWYFWYLIENDVYNAVNLIGSLYKIIAKILANRLVGVLGDIVNEVQSAFIADRQILDGPFILNEQIQWSLSKAREDDERHQESRQDRSDHIMLQQDVHLQVHVDRQDI
nr:RNA-directed DNA polymerase, eukaryota [Tanacetum cinerariifolium]